MVVVHSGSVQLGTVVDVDSIRGEQMGKGGRIVGGPGSNPSLWEGFFGHRIRKGAGRRWRVVGVVNARLLGNPTYLVAW